MNVFTLSFLTRTTSWQKKKKKKNTTGATEDATLLLQPKDHSDQDPRADSFVNHPTTSDTIVILVALMQALAFLVLVVVRWRFLELGRPHGQPGHIHIPTYRFVMPVAQSIAWVSTLLGCSFFFVYVFFLC